jgi:hypothetical protein
VAWKIGVANSRNGYASEAATAIVDWLVAGGMADVRALIHPDHRASARVAARPGFESTDELVDGERVGRLRQDARAAQPGLVGERTPSELSFRNSLLQRCIRPRARRDEVAAHQSHRGGSRAPAWTWR